MMLAQLDATCDIHGHDPWACADQIIGRFDDGRLGIPIRDGGMSMIVIKFCPWCGRKVKR